MQPERFKKIRSIGQGEFGETLLVEDQSNANRLVIIKVPTEAREKDILNEVINNAILYTNLMAIDHPNLVKYLGFDKYQGLYVMIMEYVDGKDLSRLMGDFRQKPPLDVDVALRIAKDVCSGLTAAHAARLLHSDLKPANILIRDSDGVAKICDFGVSRVLRSTSAVMFAGSRFYSAPEMLDDRASFPADIWSLSAVLYEMVTGVLPFAWTGDVSSFKARVAREDPAPPKRLNPNVDDRLNALILRGLHKNPEKRFTAKEMLAAFEDCLAPDSGLPTDPGKPSIAAGTNRGRQMVGALSALAFAGAAVAYVRKPPVIEKVTCNPCVLEAGNSTTLIWKTTGASKIRLERDTSPSPATTSADSSGAFKDTPKQRTAYTLVATSRFGVTARSGKITVVPVNISFTSTTGYFPMVFWRVSEPTAKISLSTGGMSQPTVSLGENLPAEGSRLCYVSGLYVLTATVEGVRFTKALYVVGRSGLTTVLSAPDALPGQVKVVGDLLFLESTSSREPPAQASRKYRTSFVISSSKLVPDPWIWWQLKLKNDGSLPDQTLPVVDVWYRKKPLLESYEEVYRGKAADFKSPKPGQTVNYLGCWNGGIQSWLGKGSLLSSSRRLQDVFRVDLLVGSKRIAGGEFTVRSDPFAPRTRTKPPF